LEGVWEEYGYDPLGRRVLVNTRTKGLCTTGTAFRCASATTRMVWAGDQLLWEIRRSSESPGENITSGGWYGTVSYTHAGGIDRPLVITKDGVSILPHQNWRGEFSSGTRPDGTRSDCAPGVTTGCIAVRWPGYRTTAWHHDVTEPDIRTWWGGLVDGMRDASGQQYKRNRYYDPATGQFTQPDPIWIAGGLNSYGFAAGDPVSYDDPYGLCPPSPCADSPENAPTGLIAQGRALWGGVRLLASNLPIIGDGNDAGTLLSGHDVLANENVGIAGRVGAGIGLVSPVGGGKIVRTIGEAAQDLAQAIGRNSVSIRTPNGLRRIDLAGRAHGGVPTPHVQTYSRHVNPQTGQASITRDSRLPAPATMQDIRVAREAALRQGLRN
jgi:RHS repeat-associated protein